jgi:hypothetical protein
MIWGKSLVKETLMVLTMHFMLTPVFSAVPGPSTYFLLCIGLGVLGFARKMINRMNQS